MLLMIMTVLKMIQSKTRIMVSLTKEYLISRVILALPLKKISVSH